MTLVKICGLSTPETVDAAVDAGADMIGLVHFAKSPRHIAIETAAALAERARGRTRIVALVVDAPDDTLSHIVAAVRPDVLQLHGSETPERVAQVRAAHGIPVMKAIGVASSADIARARAALDAADHILLDAKPPATAGALPGGNGLTFDWRLVAGLDPPFAFMLSGGLVPETVATAIDLVRPWAVDVSSGVESAPGVKDPARIAAFIEAARAAGGSAP